MANLIPTLYGAWNAQQGGGGYFVSDEVSSLVLLGFGDQGGKEKRFSWDNLTTRFVSNWT